MIVREAQGAEDNNQGVILLQIEFSLLYNQSQLKVESVRLAVGASAKRGCSEDHPKKSGKPPVPSRKEISAFLRKFN